MTAATITTQIVSHEPNHEYVVLTATDGETYVSKKFATVLAAFATPMEDMGAVLTPVSLAVSTKTVTIHWDSVTDKKLALHLVGNLGN